MNRHGIDWTPLAESDPLPGDPDAIRDEAARLRKLGLQMREQIVGLRRIAATPDLVGKSIDALRASAGEIVVGLEKAVERHEKTTDILTRWYGELTRLQAATRAPLDVAVEAKRLRVRAETEYAAAIPVGLAGAGPGAMYDYQVAVAQADELLGQARKALQDILEEHERLDRDFAHLIDDATNDDAEDGRWDNFKDWIDRNQKWIHVLTETLGWIGVAAAVLALALAAGGIVVGGLAAVALVTTAGALVGHSTLASAGHASKMDIALDVVALVTFGAGRGVNAALKGKQVATRTASMGSARRSATDASLAASHSVRSDAARVLADPASTPWARIHARVAESHATRNAERAGENAAKGVQTLPLPQLAARQKMAAGNPQDAVNLADVSAMVARHSSDAAVLRAAGGADEIAKAGRTALLVGVGVEGADRIYDDRMKWEPYMKIKGESQREMGSTW